MIPIRTIILLTFGFMVLYLVLRSLRAMRLKERYALLMLFVGLPFLILAAWPDAVVFLSEHLQIEKPTLLVMGLTGFVVLIIFELLSIVSVQERKIASLTQMLGIVMHKQKELERSQQEVKQIDEQK